MSQTEPTVEPAKAPATVAPIAGATEKKSIIQFGDRGVALSSFDELFRFSNAIVASGLAPKSFKTAEQVIVAIQFGMELGLPPMAALNSVMVVGGRPSLWGDAVPGICAKLTESYKDEEIGTKGADDWGWRITVKRVGRADPIVRTFTVADAKTAKLWQKKGNEGQDTPWITNPSRMLFARARTFAFRDLFPDLMRGLLTVEEARDIPAEPKNVTPTLDSLNA